MTFASKGCQEGYLLSSGETAVKLKKQEHVTECQHMLDPKDRHSIGRWCIGYRATIAFAGRAAFAGCGVWGVSSESGRGVETRGRRLCDSAFSSLI